MDIPSVILFTVHLLQNLINKQWIGALPEDKTEVRRFLNEYLLSHHKKLPGYIRNKLVKVIVDIGRVDWPHFYPNFLSNIIEVSRNKLSKGLMIRWKMILAVVSEQLMSEAEYLMKNYGDQGGFYRPRRITPSEISIILIMIRKPNSIIVLLFIRNNS